MPVLTPEEFSKLIDEHGGYVGVTPQDRMLPDPDPVLGANRKLDTKSPYPTLQYTLRDGKKISVHYDPTAGPSGGWNVDEGSASALTASATSKPQIYTDPSDGSRWTLNPDGSKTRLTDAAAGKPPTPTVQIPDPQHPGQFIDVTPAQAQAYINQQRADTTAASQADRNDLGQQRVDLATQKQQYSQIQQAADNEYKRLQLQVQQGQLSNSQAIAEFDRFWKMNVDGPKAELDAQAQLYNTGQSAGMDAATLAQMGTKDLVGPGFGANFADALTGLATGDRSKVHFGAGDFTYNVPDYSAIASKAAAQAIAHLSPYAASIAGTAAPSGYQPPTQPGVVAAAANSVVAPPNPSPIQQPPYRPAGFVG